MQTYWMHTWFRYFTFGLLIVMFIAWLLGCSETYYLDTHEVLDLVFALQVKKVLDLAWDCAHQTIWPILSNHFLGLGSIGI